MNVLPAQLATLPGHVRSDNGPEPFWERIVSGYPQTTPAVSEYVDGSLQGREFIPFRFRSTVTLEPLPWLHGRKWDELALAYLHSLRPSWVRVIPAGQRPHQDPHLWRVTVFLDNDGASIRAIEQEVDVGLPDGIDNGDELDLAARRPRLQR